MQVTVKYFGLTHSIAGKREEMITLSEGKTLDALKGLLYEKYPLSTTQAFFNVNGKGVLEEEMDRYILSDGDAIMVIPPISGG